MYQALTDWNFQTFEFLSCPNIAGIKCWRESLWMFLKPTGPLELYIVMNNTTSFCLKVWGADYKWRCSSFHYIHYFLNSLNWCIRLTVTIFESWKSSWFFPGLQDKKIKGLRLQLSPSDQADEKEENWNLIWGPRKHRKYAVYDVGSRIEFPDLLFF